jgi:peptidoglycan/xylan/chitin deacetylase (PgdA/CDA1 family)
MRKTAILSATATAGIVGILVAWPQAVVRVLGTLFPDVIWTLRTRERVIAITFDDGPDPTFTPEVLAILRKHGITATFFLVGERVRRFPEFLRQIRNEGHDVGNHSDSWHRTIQTGNDEFERDLLRAEQSLELRDAPKLFRPAGGLIRSEQIRLLRSHQYSVVLGSAYAFDPYRPPTKYIEWAITRGLKEGAIIVLHDSGGNRWNTVKALPAIIENAHAAGYRFVKLSEYSR